MENVTLRDRFAMAALIQPDVWIASIFSGRWAAWIAYQRADAMMKAREQ